MTRCESWKLITGDQWENGRLREDFNVDSIEDTARNLC